jgi:hypothetical protein
MGRLTRSLMAIVHLVTTVRLALRLPLNMKSELVIFPYPEQICNKHVPLVLINLEIDKVIVLVALLDTTATPLV